MATDRRRRRLCRAVANRCRSVQLVLDGLTDRGNINACLRTAEGFGLLVVHIIEAQTANRPRPRLVNPRSSAGAGKWLQIHYWSRPADCLNHLLGLQFQLLALDPGAVDLIDDYDFKDRPTALILGSEIEGLDPVWSESAELRRLPILGLVQSYNVSVAAALAIQTVYHQRRGDFGDLSPNQRRRLLERYLA